MPKQLLPIEHRPQEENVGCLAACAQMALGHLGIAVTQRQLNRLFDLKKAGALLSHIDRAQQFGVRVIRQPGTEQAIKSAINQGIPPVLFVRTGQLKTYWQEDVQHALLVVGYDDTDLYLNDPAFPDAPKQVPLDEVMLAWLEFDYAYALITR